ncbi:MAG: TonB-dependent receptor [Robiginitomaculum sp.]|nr:MAG: TonB-dependent receptor [Robiginitomaculum sp.]
MKHIENGRGLKRAALLATTAVSIMMMPMLANAAEGIDEIIVTAQKRDQNVQDVPISLQVITADFIDDLAADNIADISQFIPGLDVSAGSPTQPRYKIRGVSTSDFGVGTDSAVGVYVDGVYSARSGSAVLAFGDIERIEVLKGPQGTLFGRNSAAGAVSIITNKPVDGFEAMAKLRIGNYGKKRVEGMVNFALSDTVAVRINALFNQRDGLYTDAVTGQDLNRQKNWAARGALRWSPTDRSNMTITWTHDDLNQDARPAIGIVPIPAAPGLPGIPVDTSTYLNPLTAPIRNDVIDNHETRSLDEATLIINHELGDISFTSTTAWRHFETENREDEDGTNRIDLYFDTNNVEDNDSWYQELKFAGENGSVNWLVGASYFSEKAIQRSETHAFTDGVNTTLGNLGFGTPFADIENFLLIPFGIPATLFGHEWTETMANEGNFSAYAIYADAIWAVNDRLNISIGGRYTHDKKDFEWLNGPRVAPSLDATLASLDAMGLLALAGTSPAAFQFDLVFDISGVTGVPCDNGVTVAEGVACVLEDSWDNFSPRIVADYQINDNIMAYASFAKGYKAGGFNSVEVASRFDNEDVSNFELGFKSSYPEANLTFNVSGFYYVYKDKQSIRLVQATGSSIPQYLVQTSDDQALGADVQIQWAPSTPLSFFGNLQIIDATFKNNVTRSGIDLSGEPTGEPTLSAAFGGKYTHDLNMGGSLSFQAAQSFRSKTRLNKTSVAQGTAAASSVFETGTAQGRTDVRLSWTSPSGQFEWGMYANNLFDNQYVNSINNLTAGSYGTPHTTLSNPRFWGSDIKFKF